MNPHHKLQVSDIHHVVTILELIHKNNLSHLLFWSIYSEIGDNIFDFEQTIYRLAATECELEKLIANTTLSLLTWISYYVYHAHHLN